MDAPAGPSSCAHPGLETRLPGTQQRRLGPRRKPLPAMSLLGVHVVKSCLHTLECAVPSEEWIPLLRVWQNKPVKRAGGWQEPGAIGLLPLTRSASPACGDSECDTCTVLCPTLWLCCENARNFQLGGRPCCMFLFLS